jgi:hypothetical protein
MRLFSLVLISPAVNIILCSLLVGCTTANYKAEDLAPAPQVSQAISGELAKFVDPSSAWVDGCSTVKFEPDHLICSGKFSFLTSTSVRKPYERAAKSVLPPGMKMDFSAEESFASHLVVDLVHGLVIFIAGGISGGHYYGSAFPSKESLEFSIPEVDRIP